MRPRSILLWIYLLLVLAAIGAEPPFQRTPNTTNISSGTPANSTVPTWNNALSRWEYQLPPGAVGGEANTASTIGNGFSATAGKVGVDLKFTAFTNDLWRTTLSLAGNTITVGSTNTMTVVDVTDPAFGAKKDKSVDASAAIQAAIDFVNSNGRGGRVHLPAGQYLIGTGFTIRDHVWLSGEASGAGDSNMGTYLEATGGNTTMISLGGQGWQISGMFILGNDSNLAIRSTNGISAVNWRMENVKIRHCAVGLWLHSAWIGQLDNCLFGVNGIGLDFSNQVNAIKVVGGHYIQNTTNAVWIHGGSCYANSLIGATIESNTGGPAVNITEDEEDIQIAFCHFENNSESCISANNMRALNVIGNHFNRPAGSDPAVWITNDCRNPWISGNGFINDFANDIVIDSVTTRWRVDGNYHFSTTSPKWTLGNKSGTLIYGGMAQIQEVVTQQKAVTFANGNNTAVDLGGHTLIKVSGPTGAFTICGIAAGVDGYQAKIFNLTGQNMTVANESGTEGTAGNRITTMTGADLVSTGNASVTLVYDSGSSRWIATAWEP